MVEARNILEQCDQLFDHAQKARKQLTGTLHIGCFRTLSMHVVPHVMEWFAEYHPQVKVVIHEGNGEDIQERMLAGQLAASVIYEAQLLEGCYALLIKDQQRSALLPADHPLASHQEVSLAQLAQHPAVLLDETPSLERTLNEFNKRSLEPKVLLRTRSVQTAQNIIGRGLAYGILMAQPSHSPEGKPLVGRPISDQLPRNALMLSLPPGYSTAKTQALGKCLSELAQ